MKQQSKINSCLYLKRSNSKTGEIVGRPFLIDFDGFCPLHEKKVKLLKYGSEEKGSSLYRCSILLGFIMSKKQERLRSELLSEGKITNLLSFLT